jgi:uncharacterized membrane protein
MNRRLLILSVLVLSFIGIADSWYLYQSAMTDTALYCDIGAALDGCNIVAQSAYSKLFGIPLALYGVMFFAALFVLGALLLSLNKPILYRALYLLSIIGSLASLVFLYIQFFLIKALCIYCIASAALMFLICLAARSLWKRFAPTTLVRVL